MGGPGGSGVQNRGLRWCEDCKSKTHTPETCCGLCPFCGKRGHRKEFCNSRPEDAENAKAVKRAEKRKKERERKKEKEKLLKEAAKAAQTSDRTPAPTNSMSSYSEVDSPNLTDQRLARVNPLEIAKKCVFNFEENQMLKLNEDMEKNLDLNQVLQAKSAKGGNLNPVIQGQCFKRRLDKFFVLENMLADTGCSFNICSEQICRDLRVRIYPFKRDMSINPICTGVF